MTRQAQQEPALSSEQNAQQDAEQNTEIELGPLLQRPLRQVPPMPANGVVMGRVVSVSENDLRVRVPGLLNPQEPDSGGLSARALCALPGDWAERECAVLFENGDPSRPLIVGFLMALTAAKPQAPSEKQLSERELTVDGEKVVIRADTELELRCGESVILLQRDGRIEIRGNYITSQATATQRLRGGSIHMN